jgi:hypothetical protein
MNAATKGNGTMKMTLAKVKQLTRRALKENGLEAKIVQAAWLGQWCEPRGCCEGPLFRCATVKLAIDGREVSKSVMVEEDGSFMIR